MKTDSEFVGHAPCPSCGSSDALGLYSDGHGHCFSCGHYQKSMDDAREVGTTKRRLVDMVTGEYRAIGARKLSEATCRKYGYAVGEDKDGRVCQIAPYYNDKGEMVAQKIRYPDKSFAVVGDGKAMTLFGQNIWSAGGRRLVITEGEIDALSVAQAFRNSWPVVSVPNGAQGAKKAIQRSLEWIESFDLVVFMFDTDEPGRAAAAECAELLSPGKAAVAELPRKDANDMLQADEVEQLVSAVYQARPYRPDGIVSLEDIEERVMVPPSLGRPWFLPGLTAATFGRRLGEVYALGAGTGVGKTDFFTQSIAHDVMALGVKTGVIYLEQGVGETGRRVAGKVAGRTFHIPNGSWTTDELAETWGKLKATNRLFLYDAWGSNKWDVVRAKIRYLVASLGCEHIYLDHLTALAAAEDDERKALEKIMGEMAGMAQELKCVIHFVSHLATPEGKPHEEGGRVLIRHFKGSRAIGFWSHFMFGLERDQQDASETWTTLRVLKDRYTGQATGKTFRLDYDPETGLLSEGVFEDRKDEVMKVFGNDDF